MALLAIGLGVEEWAYRKMTLWHAIGGLSKDIPLMSWIESIHSRGSPILASLTIVTCVSVWIEGFRRRPPKSWGVGRWCVSAGCMTLLFIFIARVWCVRMDKEGPEGQWPLASVLSSEAVTILNDGFGFEPILGLIACLISARLAGWEGDMKSDVTEWFARLLAILVGINSIGYQIALVLD